MEGRSMTDLVEMIADLIPPPAVSQQVSDWPENEQEFYRHGEWTDFSDRAEQLTRMRQAKAAEAILAALNINPAGKEHDHTSTDPWSNGPNGPTAFIDGCAIEGDPHETFSMPGFEYATTTGQRKNWPDEDTPPEGGGWTRNIAAGREGWERFEHHEESYWLRRAPEGAMEGEQ